MNRMAKYVLLVVECMSLCACSTGANINEDNKGNTTFNSRKSVIWQNDNGEVVQSVYYSSNNEPKYIGETPSKNKDAQYTYYFNDWVLSENSSKNTTIYIASYSSVLNYYSVIWQNYDGTILEIDESVPYGETPSYDGQTPERNKDAQYTYTFDGWSPSIKKVEADCTYVAQYTNSLNYYNVTLDPNGGTVESTHQTIHYGQTYSLPNPQRKGYTFDGWYDDYILINSNGVWEYACDVLVAHWTPIRYDIDYTLNGATFNPNPSSYTIEDSVTLLTPTRTGYTFLGWFDDDGEQVTFIPAGTTGDLSLNALWNDGNSYSVALNANGGSVSDTSINVQYDHPYSLPTPTKTGYTFNGWYNGTQLVLNSGNWAYSKDMTLDAHWTAIKYDINYILNDGTNNSSNPASYTIEDRVTFSAPTKNGYTFLGWYEDDEITSGISIGSTGAIDVEAKWSANLNNLSVISENDAKGTVSILSGSGYSDESITVSANPINDCLFDGWYHGATKISDSKTFSFTMPKTDYQIEARFWNNLDEALGKTPVVREEERTVTYGLYPQLVVNDASLLSSLDALTTAESNGWYLFNNEYYAKTTPNPKTDCVYNDGTNVVKNKTAWFKCTPIKWNILDSNDGDYFLLSSLLIDACAYQSNKNSRNRYSSSTIRNWLNSTFYNSAFSLNNTLVQTTSVDNSAATTDSTTNPYAGSSTNDKVFLLSYQDYLNPDYGFSSENRPSETRHCNTTDWARTKNLTLYTGTYWLYGSADYLTRSPESEHYDWVFRVCYYSSPSITVSYLTSIEGVRPAVNLHIL